MQFGDFDDDARFAKSVLKAQRKFQPEDANADQCNVSVRRFAVVLVNSPWFERVIMTAVLLNSVFIALKTIPDAPVTNVTYQVADIAFLALYLGEFTVKIVAHGTAYFRNDYNRFDFFILLVSLFDFMRDTLGLAISANVAFLRVFRALRAIRALRSVSFVKSLQIIVVTLLKTLYSIGSLLTLLLLIMYIFAVAGFYLLGQDVPYGIRNDFADIPTALYTLWDMVTLNNWTDFQANLDAAYPGQEYARLFLCVFIFIGSFIFANLLIGVIIENLDQAQSEEQTNRNSKRSSLIYQKKRTLKSKQKQELVDLIQSPNQRAEQDGVDLQANLEIAYKQLQSNLRSDDLRLINVPCCHTLWIEAYLNTLKLQDNCLFRAQQVSFEIANTLVSLYQCNLGIQQTKQAVAPKPFLRSKSLIRAR